MIIAIGEILLDLFPDRSVIGGAPFNFAFHLKKMGFPVRFISRIGRDDPGDRIVEFLTHHGFQLDDIQTDPDHATGTVRVTPSDKENAFIIAEDAAWDHLLFDPHVSELIHRHPSLIYFGSLIQRTRNGRHFIERAARLTDDRTIRFCDINLRAGHYTRRSIRSSLDLCTVLKINLDELDDISEWILHDNAYPPETAADRIRAIHRLDHVILTMGSRGSLWKTSGEQTLTGAVPPGRFVDSVGAGDAYAAVCAAGLLTGLPVHRIMSLAGRFAGLICGIRGALPPDDDIYSFLKQEITI